MSSKKIWKNELVRFHVEFGPDALFERVRFKMKDVHTLQVNGSHFKLRMKERTIPEEIYKKICNFNIEEWTLKTAEVRKDRGKFYNSTWEYIYNNKKYWVSIGLGGVVETIVIKDSSGVGKCIRGGELYNFVEKVNRDLMSSEKLK